MNRKVTAVLTLSLLAAASVAAATTPDQKCQSGKAKALAKYRSCVAGAVAKVYSTDNIDSAAFYKCADRLNRAWTKLQQITGSTGCGAIDRIVDNGSTFTDRLTGLTWLELGTSDLEPNMSDRTDPDNTYALNFDGNNDGNIYTDLLATLNADDGTDGTNGWRVPNLAETLSLARVTVPGGTCQARYWTTTEDQSNGVRAFTVRLQNGDLVERFEKWGVQCARPVHGGF